ncbi:uncharacterized protein LOC143460096 [Clavelina lepadiformis]|uniref:uncharacterized protein LOC143460096 n=1 Tax=Clavelina lepadiformis TaxID=159417 RepID=UPI0040429FB4
MSVTLLSTKEEVAQKLSENKFVAVDFYADWCGPCRMISPKFAQMAGDFEAVAFCKVNVDENAEAAEQYGISAMPTFLFFKDGDKVDEVVGASEAKLKEALEKLLQ